MSRKFIALVLTAGLAVLFLAEGAYAQKADYPEKVKEIIAINFAREMMDGGYKAINADDLKKWTDAKKDMLIVDTMPFRRKLQETTHSRRRSNRVSHPGNERDG